MKAEFEEKSYELAANLELFAIGATGGRCQICGACHCAACGAASPPSSIDLWAPGQVLEGELGFDVMVDIDGEIDELVPLLGAALPPGMQWKNHFGNPARVASAPDYGSLFLQYKRPEYLLRRHGQFKDLFDGPFYRFETDRVQHDKLATFNTAANGEALVFYAAPKFATNADFLFYRQNRCVIDRTAFIEPVTGNHQYGAYDEVAAVMCSEPTEARMLTLPAVLASLRRLDAHLPQDLSERLSNHLIALRQAIESPTSAQVEDVSTAGAVRSILEFTVGAGLMWLIAVMP